MSFDVRGYWGEVGEQIATRPEQNTTAGDHSPYINYLDSRVIEKFFDEMPIAGRSVLEVGCGPGGKLRLVHNRQPARLVGADLSPVMIDLARQRLAGTDVEVVALDGGEYPFSDREFDLVFTCTVLHHNPADSIPSILTEVARVAATDVVLIESTARRSKSHSEAYHLRPIDFYARMLADHGFALKRARPVGTAVSESMAAWAMRLAHTRRLGNPPYKEGAPIAPLRLRAKRLLLPITRRLDQVVPQRSGLTEMRFSRR